MAEHSTPEERTEMPTDKRMGQLRKEGQLHMSTDVVTVASLVTGFTMLSLAWNGLYADLKLMLTACYRMIASPEPLTVNNAYKGFIAVVGMFGPDLLIIILGVAIASSLAVMLQTNWNVKEKKLTPKFSMLNPINGIKRIFSITGVVNTLKAIMKLALILPLAYIVLKGFAPQMSKLIHTSVDSVLFFTGQAMSSVFWKIIYILIALAIFDFMFGRNQWLRTNKMTKNEVKDERKAIEGDEVTKRKIVQKGLARIMQRIMSSVPKADVVITNPTHYAVALQYDRDKMSAPVVVAKGKGFLALRIREIAKQHGVPVMERKTLARALYGSTEVGTEIPGSLFRAVAEVLAYVYRIKNKGFQAAARQ
ncbi:MAG: flagellar biosynthesis protein FlhB [Deltaproteobacteria bacterium]|nr:flagellar biosynthesis protein FlhB [Deltaproteobacteria bacterium]